MMEVLGKGSRRKGCEISRTSRLSMTADNIFLRAQFKDANRELPPYGLPEWKRLEKTSRPRLTENGDESIFRMIAEGVVRGGGGQTGGGAARISGWQKKVGASSFHCDGGMLPGGCTWAGFGVWGSCLLSGQWAALFDDASLQLSIKVKNKLIWYSGVS